MARNSLQSVMKLINDVTTEQPIEKQFLQELKRSIEMTDEKYRSKPTASYKPSGMNCTRSMYYQVSGTEPDKSDSGYCLIGICESGTDRHIRIQNAVADMKNNGFDCEYVDVAEFVRSRELNYLDIIEKSGNETKLFHKHLNMRFLCDGIIRYKGKYIIVEFKTESIYKWQNRHEVNPDHYNQAIAYSVALGLDDVMFIYINRDNTDMKSYMFHVTDDMKQDFVGRIDYVDNYVKQMKVPPKPTDVPRKSCEYCNYKSSCRKDGD